MTEILGIIPARGGSKGIPKKNLVEVDEKPLLYYTLSESIKSRYLNRIVLSTDDDEIADYAKSFNPLIVPFIRPSHLAKDDTPMFDVVENALNWLDNNEGYKPDVLVLLHPTSPLRTARHIDGAIMILLQDRLDSLVSVSKPQEHPMEMVYFKDGEMRFVLERKSDVSSRQEYPNCYFLNGMIYVTKIDVLRRSKMFWGGRVSLYLTDTLDSIDVDTRDDMIIAECLLKRRRMV